jgi:hypothetical protein
VWGGKAEAYKWLQKAVDAGFQMVYRVSTDPLFDNLRDDGRFKEIVTQLETKVAEIRKEIEAME